jgi:hypothetical protein
VNCRGRGEECIGSAWFFWVGLGSSCLCCSVLDRELAGFRQLVVEEDGNGVQAGLSSGESRLGMSYAFVIEDLPRSQDIELLCPDAL